MPPKMSRGHSRISVRGWCSCQGAKLRQPEPLVYREVPGPRGGSLGWGNIVMRSSSLEMLGGAEVRDKPAVCYTQVDISMLKEPRWSGCGAEGGQCIIREPRGATPGATHTGCEAGPELCHAECHPRVRIRGVARRARGPDEGQ